jgi:hypothetical protein
MDDVWVDDAGPRLLAAVPCEDGAASAAMADGRVSLQRIYYDVYAAEFPAAFDRLNVATVWMGGEPGREYPVGARLSDPGGEVLAEVEMDYRARPEPATAILLLHFSSDGVMLMRLPAPGRYSVDVLLNRVPVFTLPIYAIGPAQGEQYP